MIFFKWANLGLFFIYFLSFQTNNTIFTTNQCETMSIQYMALGFEPRASWTWVVITTRPGLPPPNVHCYFSPSQCWELNVEFRTIVKISNSVFQVVTDFLRSRSNKTNIIQRKAFISPARLTTDKSKKQKLKLNRFQLFRCNLFLINKKCTGTESTFPESRH